MNLRNWPFALILSAVALPACSTPNECKGVSSIYDGDSDNDACLEALGAECGAYGTQADCWAAEPLKVGATGETVYCAWMNVATVANPQTCEVASTFGRCEPTVRAPWDGPSNGCVEGGLLYASAYSAFVDDLELVDGAVGGPDDNVYATLPSWTGSNAVSCSESGEAPAVQLCSCAAMACMATSD